MLAIERALLIRELNALADRPVPAGGRSATSKVVILTKSGMRHEGWLTRIDEGDMHVHLSGTPTDREAVILLSQVESFHYQRRT